MKFAVIDIETTWMDKVMSIGIVIADGSTKKELVLNTILFFRNLKAEECFQIHLLMRQMRKLLLCHEQKL